MVVRPNDVLKEGEDAQSQSQVKLAIVADLHYVLVDHAEVSRTKQARPVVVGWDLRVAKDNIHAFVIDWLTLV